MKNYLTFSMELLYSWLDDLLQQILYWHTQQTLIASPRSSQEFEVHCQWNSKRVFLQFLESNELLPSNKKIRKQSISRNLQWEDLIEIIQWKSTSVDIYLYIYISSLWKIISSFYGSITADFTINPGNSGVETKFCEKWKNQLWQRKILWKMILAIVKQN